MQYVDSALASLLHPSRTMVDILMVTLGKSLITLHLLINGFKGILEGGQFDAELLNFLVFLLIVENHLADLFLLALEFGLQFGATAFGSILVFV